MGFGWSNPLFWKFKNDDISLTTTTGEAHRITFWLITSYTILCHTSVSKIDCHFHNCQCNHEYIDMFLCSVHFHGYVSICVKGRLKQTYDLVNFEDILSFKNRINVWMSVLSWSVQSSSLLWPHWHVVWQHWPLLTLSSKLSVLLLIFRFKFNYQCPLPPCLFLQGNWDAWQDGHDNNLVVKIGTTWPILKHS